jgi:hypothetical protein
LRVLVALLAIAMVALAGCSTARDPGGDAPAATTGATGTASTSGPANATGTSPADAPPTNRTAAVDVPLERAGRTWTTACVVVPPAVGQCRHVAEGSALTEPLPGGEPVLRFRGTLTWADGNEVVGIGVVAGEGDDVMMVEGAYAEGASPLEFDFDVSAAANATLGFHVASYANVGAGPANAGVSPGQDWRLAGTLTVLRAV